MLAIIYTAITLTAGFIAGYDLMQFKLLIFLILNQFLLSLILYLRSNISALHFFKTDSMISVLDRFLMIAIMSVILWNNFLNIKLNISVFIYSQTIAYFITAFVSFFIVLHHSETFKFRINKPFLLSTLKQTYPYAILVFLMSIHSRFDAILIERLLPDGKLQAGIYAQSFRLLDALSQFSLLFAALLLPIFSRMIFKKQKIDDLVEFSFFLLITPSIIFVVSSVLYSNEIIELLYHDTYGVSSKVFSILIITFIPISSNYIFGTLLTANGNLKKLNYIAAGAVIINIVLNLTLIPPLKAQGAAVAAISTQLFTAVLQLFFSFRLLKIKFSQKKTFSIALFLILFIISTFLIRKIETDWKIGFSLIIIWGFICAFLFKIINIKMIIRLLKGYEN